MGLESTFGAMVTNMKESGKHASGMVRDATPLSGATSMSESTPGEKRRATVSIPGKTGISTQGSFSTAKKMDRAAGRRVVTPTQIHTKEVTNWIKSMGMENLFGPQAASTREITIMT